LQIKSRFGNERTFRELSQNPTTQYSAILSTPEVEMFKLEISLSNVCILKKSAAFAVSQMKRRWKQIIAAVRIDC
jgi:hypothetical protein